MNSLQVFFAVAWAGTALGFGLHLGWKALPAAEAFLVSVMSLSLIGLARLLKYWTFRLNISSLYRMHGNDK